MSTEPQVILETDSLIVTNSTSVTGELGVLAKRDIQAGEVLFLVRGPIQNTPTKYSFAAGIDQHIEPTTVDGKPDFGHYMNHSCDPTAFVRVICNEGQDPFIEIVTRRNIRKGEELTFDYASLEYDVTISGKTCKCNTNACRGEICGFKDLPADVITKYTQEGIIPDHLLNIQAPL